MTMRSKLIFVLATFFALTCQPILSSLDIVDTPLTEPNEQNTNGRAAGDWEWSTDFGQSSGNDGAWGITVNSDNESFITGHFRETVSFGSCSTCTHTPDVCVWVGARAPLHRLELECARSSSKVCDVPCTVVHR